LNIFFPSLWTSGMVQKGLFVNKRIGKSGKIKQAGSGRGTYYTCNNSLNLVCVEQ